eukprot:jgi/Bigna1/83648/fgenesh1_pg.112_\
MTMDTNIAVAILNAYYEGGTAAGTNDVFIGITNVPQGVLDCTLRINLVGQLTFTDQTRFLQEFNIVNAGNGEIDTGAYLDSLQQFTNAREVMLSIVQLASIFGDIDNVHILSSLDFGGSTIGLAFIGTTCDTNGFNTGVNQFTRNRADFHAAILAHELGCCQIVLLHSSIVMLASIPHWLLQRILPPSQHPCLLRHLPPPFLPLIPQQQQQQQQPSITYLPFTDNSMFSVSALEFPTPVILPGNTGFPTSSPIIGIAMG